MNKKIRNIGVLFLMTLVFSSCSNKRSIVFKNANIIPMTNNTILEKTSIHILDGKIIAIGNFQNFDIPGDTLIINAKGKYITPGFSDMHVHINNPEDYSLFVANGITLVRNMWGEPRHLESRNKIKNKEIIGPEVFTSGPIIDGKTPVWQYSLILDNKEKVEPAIKKMKADGYDFIKVYERLSREVYLETIRVANNLNMPVIGHIPNSLILEDVISAGQTSIEHFNGYNLYEKDFNHQVDITVNSQVWNCPTLIVTKTLRELKQAKENKKTELKYVNPDTLSLWGNTYSYPHDFAGDKKILKAINTKGGKIVSGTDTGNPYVVAGFSLHQELEHMNNAGLTPYQVLQTTTINPAKMLNIDDRIGTIEIGKDADLVLLHKNPLEDIKNTRTIAGVMTKGRWFHEKRIQKILSAIETNFKEAE